MATRPIFQFSYQVYCISCTIKAWPEQIYQEVRLDASLRWSSLKKVHIEWTKSAARPPTSFSRRCLFLKRCMMTLSINIEKGPCHLLSRDFSSLAWIPVPRRKVASSERCIRRKAGPDRSKLVNVTSTTHKEIVCLDYLNLE